MDHPALLFTLRFDFRNPDFAGTTMADRYAAALDMAEWADRLGCVAITVCEHHGSPDGYLPSPIPMLAAMAARTTNVRLRIAALIAPFHDPLRLAEDLIVLDNLSRGRVDLIVAGGYVHEEFALFGVPMNERPRRVAEAVTTLKAAFSGEPFAYRGRMVRITPTPFRAGGPEISLGGSSEPAARRAARIADGFIPNVPGVWQFYRDEVRKLGRPDPGTGPRAHVRTVALAEDPDKGWEQMAPFFLHETNAYAAWLAQDKIPASYRLFHDVGELHAAGAYSVLTPGQLVADLKTSPAPFTELHPLCGGMPPELAWSTLRLFERHVLPEFA